MCSWLLGLGVGAPPIVSMQAETPVPVPDERSVLIASLQQSLGEEDLGEEEDEAVELIPPPELQQQQQQQQSSSSSLTSTTFEACHL